MRKIKGFTILEVILAMVLIAIAAVGALAYLKFCKDTIVKSELYLSAVNRASEWMEVVYYEPDPKVTDVTQIEDDGTETPLPTDQTHTETGVELTEGRTGNRTLEIVDKGDYKVIKVTVSWD